MNATQLNADILCNLGVIAQDETVLDRVAKYLRRVAKQMTEDPTCMSKEEYFAMLDRAAAQYARGDYDVMRPDEDLTTYLRRKGYNVTTPALRRKINRARKEYAEGKTITCKTPQELQQFFDSL